MRLELLGLPLDDVDLEGMLDSVAALIADGRQRPGRLISYLNVHVVNSSRGDAELAELLRSSDLCYCDGEGIRLGARLLGHQLPERMTGADWIWDLAARAEAEGWSIFWLGGEPGVTEAAARRLQERHPQLRMDSDHGFHPPEAQEALRARIRASSPDILLVGMGTPIQERWAAENRYLVEVPVVWCLGATADFIAGKVSRGPAWLHDNQEWLARLLTEPGRLWKRYLVGNPIFLARVLKQRILVGSSAHPGR